MLDPVAQHCKRQFNRRRAEVELQQDGAPVHRGHVLLSLEHDVGPQIVGGAEPEKSPSRDPPSAKGAHRRGQSPPAVAALGRGPGHRGVRLRSAAPLLQTSRDPASATTRRCLPIARHAVETHSQPSAMGCESRSARPLPPSGGARVIADAHLDPGKRPADRLRPDVGRWAAVHRDGAGFGRRVLLPEGYAESVLEGVAHRLRDRGPEDTDGGMTGSSVRTQRDSTSAK
jgi:hypothetical protein